MPATIDVFGSIGSDVLPSDVQKTLRAAGKADVRVTINSGGGSLFDGLAIYSLLASHAGKVTTEVVGLAASAASVIAMAGQRIEMAEDAWLMVHNPVMATTGDSDELRSMADLLARSTDQLVGIYARRTKQPKDKLVALLSAETWLDATQAVELGFADAITPARRMAASADLRRFTKVPSALLEAKTMSATVAELKAALPKADAAFLVTQLEAGADVPTARAAWLDAREAALNARSKQGVPPLPENRASSTRSAVGDARAEWAEAIQEGLDMGLPRARAVSRAADKYPEVRAALVEEAQARRGL